MFVLFFDAAIVTSLCHGNVSVDVLHDVINCLSRLVHILREESFNRSVNKREMSSNVALIICIRKKDHCRWH